MGSEVISMQEVGARNNEYAGWSQYLTWDAGWRHYNERESSREISRKISREISREISRQISLEISREM